MSKRQQSKKRDQIKKANELLDLDPTVTDLNDAKGGTALGQFSVGLSAIELTRSSRAIQEDPVLSITRVDPS